MTETTGGTTARFFEELGRRGRIPLLARASGTIRFELINGRHTQRWFVGIRHGEVSVSGGDAEADCVVRLDGALFDRIVVGRANALAAMLRGALFVEGDPELLVLVQRLFPGPPPRERGPARDAGSAAAGRPGDAAREPATVPAPRGSVEDGGAA